MSQDAPITPPDLSATRARRVSLRRTCEHVRRLLTAPPEGAPLPPSGALALATADLSRHWYDHVAATEAPDGLLAQIVTDSPRLAPMADRLRRQHPDVTVRLEAVRRQLDGGDPDLDALLPRIAELLAVIDRHRRDGGELIHRAYNIDIGLGE